MVPQNDDIKIESIMPLNNPTLKEAYEWALSNILTAIWNDNTWKKTAKGGSDERFQTKPDMTYAMHYLTGISAAIKVLDYVGVDTFLNSKQDHLFWIKRALFCFLFHDYNKISDDSYHMEKCQKNVQSLLSNNRLENIRNELKLSINDICESAYLTEVKTSSNILLEDTIGKEEMSFIYNFNTLADILSSRYLKSDEPFDIRFGGKTVIPKENIKVLRLQYTHLFALSGLLRASVRNYLSNKTGQYFLWDLPNSMVYIGKNIEMNELNNISNYLKRLIHAYLTLEATMEMTDRTIRMEALSLIPLEREDLENFIKKKFNNIMHLANQEISETNRAEFEEYSREVGGLNIKGFTLSCFGVSKLRKCLMMDELDELTDDMRIAFSIRYLQLGKKEVIKSAKSNKKFKVLMDAISIIENCADTYSKKYKNIFSKDPQKSALLIPFIIRELNNMGIEVYESVIEHMKYIKNESLELDKIIRNILIIDLPEIPEVPHKSKMSIITGGPAEEVANESNLYGVNTQTFTNRLITSAYLPNGKIDEISKIENLLRKSILNLSESSAILFARIPGPVPIISTYHLMRSYLAKDTETTVGLNQNSLYVGGMYVNEQVDNSFMISMGSMNSDADAIKILDNALNFASTTQMQVLVTYANAPEFGIQKESLRFEIYNPLIVSLKYDKIRFDQIDDVKNEIILFKQIAKHHFGQKNIYDHTADVIRNFVRNPLSIFIFKGSDPKNMGSDPILGNLFKILKILSERGIKMENIKNLAEKATNIKKVALKNSNSEKTWLIRTSLDSLEKAKSSLARSKDISLDELKEYAAGAILSGIERDPDLELKDINAVKEFADALIKLLVEDYGGKIPTGNARSYLISAFEYMYLYKSIEVSKHGQ